MEDYIYNARESARAAIVNDDVRLRISDRIDGASVQKLSIEISFYLYNVASDTL